MPPVPASIWPSTLDGAELAVADALAVSAYQGGTLAFGPKASHRDSVVAWRDRTVAHLLQNLRLALAGCPAGNAVCAGRAPPTAETLGPETTRAAEAVARLRPAWAASAEKFYRAYAREQVRLAALFLGLPARFCRSRTGKCSGTGSQIAGSS